MNDKPIDGLQEFAVLGGHPFSKNNRPPFWKNDRNLQFWIDSPELEFKRVPVDNFPLIKDFEVRIEWSKQKTNVIDGCHLSFFSPSRGYVASYPYLIPLNHFIRDDFKFEPDHQSFRYEVAQSWILCIGTKDDFVCILQGHLESFINEGFYSWFKVNKAVYLAAWQKTIDLCKATFQK